MKPEAKVKQSEVVSRRSDQTQCLFRKSPFELSTVAIVKSKTKQIGMSLQKEIHVIEGTHELKLPKIDNNFYPGRLITLIIFSSINLTVR